MTELPRERARQARLAVYRQHILEAAEQVFAEKGFAGASMQEIGRLSGVSMGTIYSVFRSKDEVLEAILEQRGSEILDLARSAAARSESAEAAFLDLIRDYVRFFSARPNFLRMHLRVGGTWIQSPMDRGGKRSAMWAEIQRLQASILARGVAEGVFVDADPFLLARLFSAINQTLLAQWVEQGMQSSEKQLIEELQFWARRLLWHQSATQRRGSRRATSPPAGLGGSQGRPSP